MATKKAKREIEHLECVNRNIRATCQMMREERDAIAGVAANYYHLSKAVLERERTMVKPPKDADDIPLRHRRDRLRP